MVINGLVDEKFFVFVGVVFVMIVVSMLGRLDLVFKGLWLNNIKVEKISVVYGLDNCLNLDVVVFMFLFEVMSFLDVKFL